MNNYEMPRREMNIIYIQNSDDDGFAAFVYTDDPCIEGSHV